MQPVRRLRSAAAAVGITVLSVCGSAAPSPGQMSSPNSLWLVWVAPGDDGMVGQAAGYELKYRPVPVAGADTASWYAAATPAYGLPAPSQAGSLDSVLVTGLAPSTTYYFVARARDEWPNWSGFSNIAQGTTAPCPAPADPPNLDDPVFDSGAVTLRWQPTGDPAATVLRVYRGIGGGPLTLYQTITNLSVLELVDASVTPGATYRYRAAWGAACGDGPSSEIKSITIPGTPTADASAPRLSVYPNPASGSQAIRFVLELSGTASVAVRVKLFDLSGHWIADIANATYAPGRQEIFWNRLGRTGRVVSPGYYEAIATVDGRRARTRLALLP